MKRCMAIAGVWIILFARGIESKGPKVKSVRVRILKLTDVKLSPRSAETGRLERPAVITDAAGLADAFPDKDSQAAIAQQVDFKKDKLLFFQWAGSGRDRLTPHVVDEDKRAVVVFRYFPGETDDYRRHHLLFAVPETVPWRLEK